MDSSLFDPSLNFLQSYPNDLDLLFKPKSIAIIGATETENSVGRTLMENLIKNSAGAELFPIHPKRESVFGIKAYSDVKQVLQNIDLAIIVTPSKTVPEIILACTEKKIPTAIIISAGFKEMGPTGVLLEKQCLEIAKGKMRIIGPNCLGVMNPMVGLNATFAADMALKGSVAFISQSGALCTAGLDWSLKEKVGFSAFVSIGSMSDVDFGDLITYFGSDPHTKSILIYMESIGDARSFLSAAREVALSKPVILIKAGRTLESAQAAASHTGALSGSDDAFTAALNRVGVLRVDTIAELFAAAECLDKQPLPKGPNLTIVTNAGGPGVIATDALVQNGAQLALLSNESLNKYNSFLPSHWSHRNPIDILGDASPDIYAKTLQVAIEDPKSDGILVILTPQDMTDPTKTATLLKPFAKTNKPIFASWMGGSRVEEGQKILSEMGIPVFAYPDMACQTFAKLSSYAYHLQSLYATTELLDIASLDRQKVDQIIQKARDEKRTILDEYESKEILKAYQIPAVPTLIAKTAKQAVDAANELQYPVVVKLYSHTITHKSDVGGVKLNLKNFRDVENAFEEIYSSIQKHGSLKDFEGVTVQPMINLNGYELILGSSCDPDFGPVILFGLGGELVEIFKDRSLGLPPLNSTLAQMLLESTKIYHALEGVRGKKAVDLNRLKQILVQFSKLVTDQKWIREIDINPMLVTSDQMIALDARVILHAQAKDIPKLAIRPYPANLVEDFHLKNGDVVTIRPIRPDDEEKLSKFHEKLSLETVRQRYLGFVHLDKRQEKSFLKQMCFVDFDKQIPLVADKGGEIIGISRLIKTSSRREAMITITIVDRFQNNGLGSKFLEKMIDIAKHEKIEKIIAQMLKENLNMQKLLFNYGFSILSQNDFLFFELNLKSSSCNHE